MLKLFSLSFFIFLLIIIAFSDLDFKSLNSAYLFIFGIFISGQEFVLNFLWSKFSSNEFGDLGYLLDYNLSLISFINFLFGFIFKSYSVFLWLLSKLVNVLFKLLRLIFFEYNFEPCILSFSLLLFIYPICSFSNVILEDIFC